MADNGQSSNKPRLRKVPTMREKTDIAKGKSEKDSKKPRRSIFGFLSSIGRLLSLIFQPIAKSLSWLVPRYVVNAWREVRQVTWPSRGETWRLTGAVFIFAIVFGVLIGIVDKILDILFKNLVLK